MKLIVPVLFFCSVLLVNCKNNKNDQKTSPYIQQLKKQVAQSPDSIGLRLVLVDALDSLSNYKEALSQMDSLIQKDSLNYGFWFRKGKIEEKTDTTAALLSYNRAARVYQAPEVLLSLANLYAETKNKVSLDVCNAIDQMHLGREYDSYTSFFRGVYYARTGDKQKALELFDNCIKLNYSFMDVYIEKGSLLYEEQKYQEALVVLNLATTINNTYAIAYYWQGKCYEAMHNKTEAITLYQRAYGLDKSLVEAKDNFERLEKS